MSDPVPTTPPADRSVKIAHLVLGLLFLGLAGIWALGTSQAVDGERLLVLAPGVLVLAGVIGLVATLVNARNRSTSIRRRGPGHLSENPAGTYADTRTDTDTHTHTEEIR